MPSRRVLLFMMAGLIFLTVGLPIAIALGVPLSPWPLSAYDGLRDWPVIGRRIAALHALDWSAERLSALAFYYTSVSAMALVIAALFPIALVRKRDPKVVAAAMPNQRPLSVVEWMFAGPLIGVAWWFVFWGPGLVPDPGGRYSLWLMAFTNMSLFFVVTLAAVSCTAGLPIVARDAMRRREFGRIALAILTFSVLTGWIWPTDPTPDSFKIIMATRVEQAVAAKEPVQLLVTEMRAAGYQCVDLSALVETQSVYNCDIMVRARGCRLVQSFALTFDAAGRLESAQSTDGGLCP